MKIHGLFGFYYNKLFYVVYNSNSYPTVLGNELINEIKSAIKLKTFDNWMSLLKKITIINALINPTHLEIQHLQKYKFKKNITKHNNNFNNWNTLLDHCQDTFLNILECGFIDNEVDHKKIPFWQEYNYILNFDTMQLDFYIEYKIQDSFDVFNLPFF